MYFFFIIKKTIKQDMYVIVACTSIFNLYINQLLQIEKKTNTTKHNFFKYVILVLKKKI